MSNQSEMVDACNNELLSNIVSRHRLLRIVDGVCTEYCALLELYRNVYISRYPLNGLRVTIWGVQFRGRAEPEPNINTITVTFTTTSTLCRLRDPTPPLLLG